MAGLALGVASLVAPPVAAAIPAIAIVVCAIALLRIRREPSLAGRSIAVAGLLIAVFAVVAASTYWLVRDWQLRRTAERYAATFVERLVEGDARAAHQMTLPPNLRFASDAPLADSYRRNAAARDRLAAFQRDPVVRRLRQLRGAKIAAADVQWHEALRTVDGFGVHVYVGGETRESAAVVVRVLVERARDSTANDSSAADWVITKQFLEEPLADDRK